MSLENSNIETFSNFGKNFQDSLVHLITKDRSFCDQIREVLDISFFEHKYLQVFTKKIFEFKDKYKIHPNNESIKTILKLELNQENETIQEQIKEFFVKICSKKEIENQEFIKDQSLQFCKKQVLKKAMIESIDLLQKSSFDEINKIINGALKKGCNNDLGSDYIEDFEERYKFKTRNPIATGLPEIDKLIQSGLGIGELGVIVGSSGSGKSMILTFLGAKALLQGKNVVHYTLELSENVIGKRYDSCITHVSINELSSFKEQVFEEISKVPGKLIIKEYPSKGISLLGIRNHIEKVQQRDIKIDMIIVDYLDLLKSSISYKEKRYELETITEELRGLAQSLGCPLWTASQTNRQGARDDIVETTSISEAYNKVFPADLIITLSRKKEDKEANTGRLYIAKNRFGAERCFNIFFDPEHVNIKILEGLCSEKLEEEKKQENTENIKKQYKEYRKSL